ncbi:MULTISPECIES: hypothetical protein [Holospora]|nr:MULTISPECIES: hypothetical protein [Holospora]GAJ45701.1 hypothetical protein HE1_00010 [Holospora elegans E1]
MKNLSFAHRCSISLDNQKITERQYLKKNTPYTTLADFSSWNLPFSVLGPDANPLNALPSALGGQSRVGSGNLMLLFKHQ